MTKGGHVCDRPLYCPISLTPEVLPAGTALNSVGINDSGSLMNLSNGSSTRAIGTSNRLKSHSEWSLALIGNASGQTVGVERDLDPRRFR